MDSSLSLKLVPLQQKSFWRWSLRQTRETVSDLFEGSIVQRTCITIWGRIYCRLHEAISRPGILGNFTENTSWTKQLNLKRLSFSSPHRYHMSLKGRLQGDSNWDICSHCSDFLSSAVHGLQPLPPGKLYDVQHSLSWKNFI